MVRLGLNWLWFYYTREAQTMQDGESVSENSEEQKVVQEEKCSTECSPGGTTHETGNEVSNGR